MLSENPFITLAIAVAGVLLVRAIVSWKRQPNYPPGPPRLPLIGNLLNMPNEERWVQYAKWRDTYGDVIYLDVMGTPIVVLNSYKAVYDLMEKRSEIYSDRNDTVVSTKLMSWGNAVTLAPYGDRWRRYRRITAQTMRKESVKKFHPVQEKEAANYLGLLLKDPENFVNSFRFIAGRALLWNIYGYKVTGTSDHIIDTVEKAMVVGVFAAQPGNFLVDLFPPLVHLPKWFPGAGFKEWARKGEILTQDMVDLPFNETLKGMNTGDYPPSFTAINLDKGEESDLVKWCSGTMFGAGIDTSVATIHALFLAMLLFPDVQKRAHDEIDSVCGSSRLPTIEDRDDLPYVNALMKELLRWQPVLPAALPHRVMRDDIYNGYLIPAKAIVLGNTWAITRDPEYFPDPERFEPQRYLDKDSKAIDPVAFAYGYGRRICAGIHYADTMMFASISRILATFKVTPSLDKAGNEIIPEPKFNSMMVRESLDFPVTIKPRSEATKALILANITDPTA